MIRRLFFVVPVQVALLLCFDSCANNDNIKSVDGAIVASLPLKVRIGNNISSRVGMTDSYGGAFSCYWNSDRLNIYHQYVLNGSVLDMVPLEFATSTTSGTSATFSYTGTDAYRYNPGSRLYAFSSNTSGGYTASVTNDGIAALTVSALASQTGTLTDCAKYDALYGSATVNYDTGLPESLTMYHLFGMLNLHLTNSSFSTSSPVTVTLTSSDSNILPGNSGSASLASNGTTLTTTGSWGTSWSTTITPATDGVVDIYLMTWPFQGVTGTLTITAKTPDDNIYSREIALSNFSLLSGHMKAHEVILNASQPSFSLKYYRWDGVAEFDTSAPSDYNTTSGVATHSCAECPTYDQMQMYLGADVYWDNTTKWKDQSTGTTYTGGLWVKKKQYIAGFDSGTAPKATWNPGTGTLSDKTNYFFLPAGGIKYYDSISSEGVEGRYWSSTPADAGTAYRLLINSGGATVTTEDRTHGFDLFFVQ